MAGFSQPHYLCADGPPRGGVIGVRREQALERFRTVMPVKFETSHDDPWVNAVLIVADGGGLATSIKQLLVEASP